MLLQDSSGAADTRRAPSAKPARQLELALVATLLFAFAAALGYGAWRTGLTVDEPSHLISAYLYWHGRDRLPPSDMPPLIRMVGGWPLRSMDLPVPPDLGQPGDTRHEWNEGAGLIERLPPERIGRVVFWPRVLLIVFPVLSALVLWKWARDLFGAGAALCALVLWVCSPTVLGHGGLFKNDHASACTYLLFWYCAWCLWRRPSPRLVLVFAGATAAVVLSKMSMLFLLGVAPALLALRFLGRRKWLHGAAALLVHAILCYVLILAAYQFETIRVTSNDLNALSADRAIPSIVLSFMRPFEWLSIPGAMWKGVLNLFRSNDASAAYFMGYLCPGGDPLYFLVALGLKTPLLALAAVLAGIGYVIGRGLGRHWCGTDLFWIVPGALYLVLASSAALQLGVRLVLPAWPFLILFASSALGFLLRRQRNGVWIVMALLAAVAVESAIWYPNGIAYYNQIAGGPRGSLRYLADSNIDWGQGLPELARWLKSNNVPSVRLAHFGFDKPERYLRPEQVKRLIPPWNAAAARGRTQIIPERGHYYAISAALLPGYFFQPPYRNWYARFWNMKPVAAPGGCILVYKLD
jgi:hypothetical protein